jgi:tRNA-Thr(GGU) m(6)t(6)A37 methyltransferase TsaA
LNPYDQRYQQLRAINQVFLSTACGICVAGVILAVVGSLMRKRRSRRGGEAGLNGKRRCGAVVDSLPLESSSPENSTMRSNPLLLVLFAASAVLIAQAIRFRPLFGQSTTPQQFVVRPIGFVEKAEGRTTLVIDSAYQSGLLGLAECSHVWVLYWFDRNDTPAQRRILQVHPRGDTNRPKRGVFATHAPVRPNLIAMSRCKILAVDANRVLIEEIDALPKSPILDLKSG